MNILTLIIFFTIEKIYISTIKCRPSMKPNKLEKKLEYLAIKRHFDLQTID